MAMKRIVSRGPDPGLQIALTSAGARLRKARFIGKVLVFVNERASERRNDLGPMPRFEFIVEWSAERRETSLNAQQPDLACSA